MTGFIKGKREKRCIRHLLRRAKAPRLAAEYLASVLLVLTGLFLCSPVFLLLSGSITGEFELARALKPALLGGADLFPGNLFRSSLRLPHSGSCYSIPPSSSCFSGIP